MSGTLGSESLFASLRWRWYRAGSRLRCRIGLHRWQGYHDLGDGVNVQPISGYGKPHGQKDFRRCSWCGAKASAVRLSDGLTQWFRWGPTR